MIENRVITTDALRAANDAPTGGTLQLGPGLLHRLSVGIHVLVPIVPLPTEEGPLLACYAHLDVVDSESAEVVVVIIPIAHYLELPTVSVALGVASSLIDGLVGDLDAKVSQAISPRSAPTKGTPGYL